MKFSKYKKYILNDNIELQDVFNDLITSNVYVDGYVPYEEIVEAIRSPLHRTFYKVYLLNRDEKIVEDLTDMVKTAGTIEKTSESGQCASVNLTFKNEKQLMITGFDVNTQSKTYDYQYPWTPNRADNKFWGFQKIKIIMGIVLGQTVYELNEGIFVMFDPSISDGYNGQEVSIQCYDKFALLDGTINGKSDYEYTCPLNEPIETVIKSLLKITWNKSNEPYDYKEVKFPPKYKSTMTKYTLKKTGSNTIGDLVKELALSISCDAKYDEEGCLNIADILDDIDYHNRSYVWIFKEEEIIEPKITINRSKIRNQITVVGANIEGVLCKGVAQNTNPNSLYNINGDFGIHSERIEDSLIYSDIYCEDRARYELNKYAQRYIDISFSCPFIPHIKPGDIVKWTNKKWNIENEEFLVNTVSIPLDSTQNMNMTITNIKDLAI